MPWRMFSMQWHPRQLGKTALEQKGFRLEKTSWWVLGIYDGYWEYIAVQRPEIMWVTKQRKEREKDIFLKRASYIIISSAVVVALMSGLISSQISCPLRRAICLQDRRNRRPDSSTFWLIVSIEKLYEIRLICFVTEDLAVQVVLLGLFGKGGLASVLLGALGESKVSELTPGGL